MIRRLRVKVFQKVILLFIVAIFSCQPVKVEVPPAQTVEAPDRSGPPESSVPKKLILPEIQTFVLSNGIPVYLMEKHSVPIVQIILQVNAGGIHDPEDKIGLASFTASMLDEGAGGKDALQLADAMGFLGGNLSTGSGRYTSTVSLNVPVAKLSEAMVLMADVVLRPEFPESELNRLKVRSLTSLLQERDSPNAIARAAYNKVLYGDHLFGRKTDESNIKLTSILDLKSFHKDHYISNNASFIVAGDIDMATMKEYLENHFGNWVAGDNVSIVIPQVPQVNARTIYLVDKPGSAQSIIIIGRIAVSRYSEDFYPITVMNTVLGGSFTSRLNNNLRETHGYAYGAGSRFSMGKHKGPFTASASVQTDATDKAVGEFMNELNSIRENITEEEIKRAGNYVALGYPSRFETIGDYAIQMASLVSMELPLTTFNDYTDGILDVSVDEALISVKKYIDTDNLVIVIVGDREKVESGIRDLELGAINLWTINDVLGLPPSME